MIQSELRLLACAAHLKKRFFLTFIGQLMVRKQTENTAREMFMKCNKGQHSIKALREKMEMKHKHARKMTGLIRSTAFHRPYGVTVAEVKGGDDLSEELPGLFGGQSALLHQVVK